MNKYVNEDMLIKYLVGEATDEEKAFVEKWLTENEENRKQYRDFQLLWETSEKLALDSELDENLAWDRFKQHLAANDSAIDVDDAGVRVGATKEPVYRAPAWIKLAASIVLISIGVWVSFYAYDRSSFNQILVETVNYTLVDTLADGSIITLNRNSKIQYPKHFATDHRSVKLLEGEAFFDVAPDSSKPFHVSFNDVDVKVVWTSFNIKIDEDKTELIVETGVVEVSKKHVVIRLKRDEAVHIDRNSDELNKSVVQDQLYKYYRNSEFIADGTPLYRLVDVLNEAYGVQIVIEDQELENLELNTTLKYNTSIRSNLDLICETFDIKMKKSGEYIVLYR